MTKRLPVVVALCGVIAAGASSSQAAGIVGTWRGTSLCVDREHFPSCNDERAVYEIRASGRSPDSVIVKAQKLVGNALELVSEDTFARQSDGTWRTEIVTPRFRIRVDLRLSGDSLTGTLMEMGSVRKARDISLRRHRGG